MRLLIDAGNTRIKWALTDGDEWLRSGTLSVEHAGELAHQFAGLEGIQQVWASNVAGGEVAHHIRAASTGRLSIPPHFIVACATQCGVRNGYSDPSQLGSDRWAALIAAWHLVQGPCLVVNSGTATTVDTLSVTGEFIGGLIVPGVDLMQYSLSNATAQLEPGTAGFHAFPKSTADALFSGAVQASCGAIERQYALFGAGGMPVVLSGGASATLQDHLNLPLRLVDNLVLQGLLLIAQETNT